MWFSKIHHNVKWRYIRDEEIQSAAIEFARSNKKEVAHKLTDKSVYPADNAPVSVFMAGSPGAGKTEFSVRVLELLEKEGKSVVRIDPDELRSEFVQYSGDNSDLFQAAVSILVDRIHDEAIKNSQNFILDGTLSDLERAKKNVNRSINKDRKVEVFYIYQRPEIAWDFTKKREEQEGRAMPIDAFVTHFVSSRETANALKSEFGSDVTLNLVIKDIDNSSLVYKENIAQRYRQ